jgi:hypothetical protein
VRVAMRRFPTPSPWRVLAIWRPEISRGRTRGSKPPRSSGAAERDGGQNRRPNPNKRVPRHNYA